MLISGAMTGSTRLMHSATSRLIYTWERFDAGMLTRNLSRYPKVSSFSFWASPRRAFPLEYLPVRLQRDFSLPDVPRTFLSGRGCPCRNRYVADNDFLQDIFVHLNDFLFHDCPSLSLTISSSASSTRPLPSSCLAGGGSSVQRKRHAWHGLSPFHNGTGQEACCQGLSDAALS